MALENVWTTRFSKVRNQETQKGEWRHESATINLPAVSASFGCKKLKTKNQEISTHGLWIEEIKLRTPAAVFCSRLLGS